jgi:hypothetical protein
MGQSASRLVGPAQVATGPTTIYTSPANTQSIVKYRSVNNPSGSAVTLTLTIGADAAATRLYVVSIPANTFIEAFCNWVLAAGEVITATASTNNILVLTLDGVLNTI